MMFYATNGDKYMCFDEVRTQSQYRNMLERIKEHLNGIITLTEINDEI